MVQAPEVSGRVDGLGESNPLRIECLCQTPQLTRLRHTERLILARFNVEVMLKIIYLN